MWIGPYGVGFSPPLDFEDRSTYSFKDSSERELTEVAYGNVPNTSNTAWEVLNERAGRLDLLKVHDPSLVVEPAVDLPVGRLHWCVLSFTSREKHYQFREWWAIALLDSASYVQVVYYASALDSSAVGRIQHVLVSATPAEEESARPAAPQFARRRAGRIFLDVPTRLEPRSRYCFVYGDEDEVRLDVSIHEGPAAWPEPAGEISQRQDETVVIGETPVIVTRLILTRRLRGEDKRAANMYAQVVFEDGVSVRIAGTAFVDQSPKLTAAFEEFIRHVRRVE